MKVLGVDAGSDWYVSPGPVEVDSSESVSTAQGPLEETHTQASSQGSGPTTGTDVSQAAVRRDTKSETV